MASRVGVGMLALLFCAKFEPALGSRTWLCKNFFRLANSEVTFEGRGVYMPHALLGILDTFVTRPMDERESTTSSCSCSMLFLLATYTYVGLAHNA